MKFDRTNQFDLYYHEQVKTLGLKSSEYIASKWAKYIKHLMDYVSITNNIIHKNKPTVASIEMFLPWTFLSYGFAPA